MFRLGRAIVERYKRLRVREFFWNLFIFTATAVLFGALNVLFFLFLLWVLWDDAQRAKPALSVYQWVRSAFLMDGSPFFYSMSLMGGAVYMIESGRRKFTPLRSLRPFLVVLLIVLAILTALAIGSNDTVYIETYEYAGKNLFVLAEEIIPAGCALLAIIIAVIFELCSCSDQPSNITNGRYKAGRQI